MKLKVKHYKELTLDELHGGTIAHPHPVGSRHRHPLDEVRVSPVVVVGVGGDTANFRPPYGLLWKFEDQE